jgi:hypothetical protein
VPIPSVYLVQSAIGGVSPWNVSGKVTSGNFVLVELSGAGSGTASIYDSLGTVYDLIATATNSDAGGEKATTYMWGGFLTASGPLTITVTGTFPVAAIDATGSNIGGQLYFKELAGVDSVTPIRAYATNNTGNTRNISSSFMGIPAGAMLFMVASQAYLNIDEWVCTAPSGFLHFSSGSSALVANNAPITGNYTIEMGAATTSPFFSSVAVVLNPSSLAPIPSTLSVVQSAQDSAGDNPWVTGLSITEGNLLIVSLAGTQGGSASLVDNIGTVYRQVDYYTGIFSSAISVWVGTAGSSGNLTLTVSGSFAVVSSTTYDAGGILSVVEVHGSGSAILSSFRVSGNNTIGLGSTQAVWSPEGSLLLEVAAQGWNNVGTWAAVSPASLLEYAEAISAVISSPIISDGPATIEVTSTGPGPMISLIFGFGPEIVTTFPNINVLTNDSLNVSVIENGFSFLNLNFSNTDTINIDISEGASLYRPGGNNALVDLEYTESIVNGNPNAVVDLEYTESIVNGNPNAVVDLEYTEFIVNGNPNAVVDLEYTEFLVAVNKFTLYENIPINISETSQLTRFVEGTVLNKFDPSKTMYLKGFDRRGCTASLNNATSSSFNVTGIFSDLADFAVLMIYDADDLYGYLYNNKYLPDFDLTNLILDFDLSVNNCMCPISSKYQTVPWGKLSWVKNDNVQTQGTTPLNIISTSGATKANQIYTVTGTPIIYDRVQLIYLSNWVFDHVVALGETASDIASDLVSQINASTTTTNLIAIYTGGPSFTVSVNYDGIDGNTIELLEMHKTDTCYILPSGTSKLVGGSNPTSLHIQMNFNNIFGSDVNNIRKLWLTIAPSLPIDSNLGTPTLSPFTIKDFSYSVNNWILSGIGNTNLKVAGLGSVVVDSRDTWVTYGPLNTSIWINQPGWFHNGFAFSSSNIGDTVTVQYSCQYYHDLYLGTYLNTNAGKFNITVDGINVGIIDCYSTESIITRRKIISGITAGNHIVVLTIITGNICYFDFLQAVIPSNPVIPIGNTKISSAGDFDTDQTYKISPSRFIWNLQSLGLLGDLDFYAGVFFALKRKRYGGYSHSVIVTVAGTLNSGNGFGYGCDSFFINLGDTSFGVSAYPADTLDTIKQRFINAINSTFIGVYAKSIGVGIFQITTLSPINGFTFSVSSLTFSGATFLSTGDINIGNEGIWQVDETQSLPFNSGFNDYLSDLSLNCFSAGINITVSFSQELLAPPDVNTNLGAWIQRYSDSSTVLTSTSFGTWGSGVVENLSGTIIKQTGHGYISGNTIHISSNIDSGIWKITVIDDNYYDLTTRVSSGTYIPSIGDFSYAELQTSQCAFNPNTVTPYLTKVYCQAANTMILSGIISPVLQFGETLHWFFNGGTGPSMAFYDENQKSEALSRLGRELYIFNTTNDDPSINSFQDANFLRTRIQTHCHTIRNNVQTLYPSVKFELLWPYDVNWPTPYNNTTYPYFIGGQLNRYVNLPNDYMGLGSDIDLFKIEALAWGTSYRVLDNSISTIKLPLNFPFSWPSNKVKYIIPWSNGGCPWKAEFNQTKIYGIKNIVFWAIDHIILMSWNISNIL